MACLIVTDERVARFISEASGHSFCPPYSVMGIERDGKVIAGALFNQFEGANVHVSTVGKGWTKGFLKAVGVYVFDQLGCERMTFTASEPAVVEYALRLGGKVEGVMRSHFAKGVDATIVGVLRNEWRY